jgi:hypothetical protein
LGLLRRLLPGHSSHSSHARRPLSGLELLLLHPSLHHLLLHQRRQLAMVESCRHGSHCSQILLLSVLYHPLYQVRQEDVLARVPHRQQLLLRRPWLELCSHDLLLVFGHTIQPVPSHIHYCLGVLVLCGNGVHLHGGKGVGWPSLWLSARGWLLINTHHARPRLDTHWDAHADRLLHLPHLLAVLLHARLESRRHPLNTHAAAEVRRHSKIGHGLLCLRVCLGLCVCVCLGLCLSLSLSLRLNLLGLILSLGLGVYTVCQSLSVDLSPVLQFGELRCNDCIILCLVHPSHERIQLRSAGCFNDIAYILNLEGKLVVGH